MQKCFDRYPWSCHRSKRLILLHRSTGRLLLLLWHRSSKGGPSGSPLFFALSTPRANGECGVVTTDRDPVKSAPMASYSRAQPSPRYRELLSLYGRMHKEGETRLGIPAQETFPGASLAPHITPIKGWIERTGARTILDYGAGKGLQYRPHKVTIDGRHVADGIAEYWDVDEVVCFDPGYPP